MLPLLVDIHVEPDDSFLKEGERSNWSGFESGCRLLGELRKQLEDITRAPVHFSWQFRADAQIAKNYGAHGWAFTRYAREIQVLIEAGDDIGLHQHGYRWNPESHSWTEDYASESWMEDVMSLGFEVYSRAFGKPPDTVSSGVTWTSTRLIMLAERLGARHDVTVAPGRTKAFPTELGEFTGDLPNTDGIPLHPYRPSARDFRIPAPDKSDGIWVIPLTTGRQSSGGAMRRQLRRFTGTLARHEHISKLYLQSPREYLGPVLDPTDIAAKPSHFTLDIRSDAFRTIKNRMRIRRNLEFLSSPKRRFRPAFMTPAELIENFQAARDAFAGPVELQNSMEQPA